MSQRVGMQSDIVLCGGVARNGDVVRRLEAKLGTKFLIPEDPQILGALGAALLAQHAEDGAALVPPAPLKEGVA